MEFGVNLLHWSLKQPSIGPVLLIFRCKFPPLEFETQMKKLLELICQAKCKLSPMGFETGYHPWSASIRQCVNLLR